MLSTMKKSIAVSVVLLGTVANANAASTNVENFVSSLVMNAVAHTQIELKNSVQQAVLNATHQLSVDEQAVPAGRVNVQILAKQEKDDEAEKQQAE